MRVQTVIFAAYCVLAFVAGPATAQSGFDCRQGMSGMSCRESGASYSERMNRESMQRMQQNMSDLDARMAAERARQTPNWRKKVGKAVLEGRCDDARALALENGDLDLAEKAMRTCTPAAASPTAPD